MNGKRKCSLLKSIRCRIAEKNHIDYQTTECNFQGECKGTCPKCEEELRYLAAELEKLKATGKRVAVAGIATAMVAASAAGCTPNPGDDFDTFETTGILPAPEVVEEEKSEVPEEEVFGDVIDPKYEEPEVLDGDVAYPEGEETDE